MKNELKMTLALAVLLLGGAGSAFGSTFWTFIHQEIGELYRVGQSVSFDKAEVNVRNLFSVGGEPLDAGETEFVRVDGSMIAGSQAPELLTNNSAVQVIPEDKPYYVQFRFGTTGGRLFNIAANGQRARAENVCDLDGVRLGKQSLGRVVVTVVPNDDTCQGGYISLQTLNGSIDRWLFGGQVTRIDDILMTP